MVKYPDFGPECFKSAWSSYLSKFPQERKNRCSDQTVTFKQLGVFYFFFQIKPCFTTINFLQFLKPNIGPGGQLMIEISKLTLDTVRVVEDTIAVIEESIFMDKRKLTENERQIVMMTVCLQHAILKHVVQAEISKNGPFLTQAKSRTIIEGQIAKHSDAILGIHKFYCENCGEGKPHGERIS